MSTLLTFGETMLRLTPPGDERIESADSLAVNVGGSLLLGLVIGAGVGSPFRLAAAVGFCGAFTTFSSFAVRTVRLAEDEGAAAAVANAAGTLLLALLAVRVGLAVGGLR